MNPALVAVAAGAYLLGSIPWGYVLVKLFRGSDVRETGSGNIGATNVARSGGAALGALTLFLDATKGFAAVLAARWLAQSSGTSVAWFAAVAALFVILGHVFPVWLRFKGGKGVATGLGAFLAVAPKAVGLAVLLFLAIVLASRYVSLGSIAAAAAFPVISYLLAREQSPALLATIVAASALIIVKHHANIRRLLAGTENKLQWKGR